jgi:spore cortex formation protein SpoVR/YcgB (stage V sporulation)
MHRGRPLEQENAEEVVRHLQQLWGFDVVLESVMDGAVKSSIAHSELSRKAG